AASSGAPTTTNTVNVSGTDVVATTGTFTFSPIPWPAGMTVYISGTPCASPTGVQIDSVNSTTDITLASSCGTATGATMTQPANNFMPYGAWWRMKASVTPVFDSTCTTVGCQNIVNAVYTAL